MEKLLEKVEDLGWSIYPDKDYFALGKFSPAGQDFHASFNASNKEEFLAELYEVYKNYDPSEEAYLWLDNSGHGTNGAPYDMRVLYNDMEACKLMVLDLYKLKTFVNQ